LKAFPSFIRFLTLPLFLSFMTSCSGGGDDFNSAPSTVLALPYCSTITTYSDPVTITGQAVYEYRANGNGAVASPNPIRRAEVRVTDAAGNIIQCGETDASGQISLQLPNNGTTVTITVTSRADNNFVKASVLNNPTANGFYGLTVNVVLDGPKNFGTLTALATGSVLAGGAFNILDKILDANDYLRTQTNNCSTTFSTCLEFTVAPMVNVYWTRGVNPGDYFNIGPLSFYVPTLNHLYILGGINGDVDNTDTDHFDDSVVLHEYGHALETLFSIPDSPGGAHNGDQILDPRLAWSEAWANFFQAAVLSNFVYRDTFGTPNGTAGVFINESLETASIDTPTEADEGNFREFSISRALVDIVDPDEMNATDDLQSSFAEIWTILAGSGANSFASATQNFRSVGLFYELQQGLAGGTNWSTIQGAEEQLAARTHYANTLSNGAACPTTILAESVPGASPLKAPGSQPEDGSFVNSNQFKSNDFYQVEHPGGPLEIVVDYTTTGGNAADLDIYLYQNTYRYGDSTTMVGFSEDTIPPAAGSDIETINISSLAAGTYLLNVRYDTSNGIRSAANYNLTINSQGKCPD
jgi:hypothetical protein